MKHVSAVAMAFPAGCLATGPEELEVTGADRDGGRTASDLRLAVLPGTPISVTRHHVAAQPATVGMELAPESAVELELHGASSLCECVWAAHRNARMGLAEGIRRCAPVTPQPGPKP